MKTNKNNFLFINTKETAYHLSEHFKVLISYIQVNCWYLKTKKLLLILRKQAKTINLGIITVDQGFPKGGESWEQFY